MSRFTVITSLWVLLTIAAVIGLEGVYLMVALTMLISVYTAILTLGVSQMRLNLFCQAVVTIPPGSNRVALTFDDGPDGNVTGPLLDALRDMNVQAMFFCVGCKVEKYPDLARRIIAEGHSIGNHSFRHARGTNFLFGRALRKEIADTQAIIEKTTGIRPKYFRPPMGLTNPHLAAVLKAENLTLTGWDIRSFDLGSAKAQDVVRRVLSMLSDGSIVLLHDGSTKKDRAIEITTSIIHAAREQGFSFQRLDLAFTDADPRKSRSAGDY